MNIGKLKTLGKLQSPPTAQDELGQPTGDWTDVASEVWADIRLLSGVETIKGGAETGVAKVSVRIRARSDVTNGMRYLVGSTAYNFKSVPPKIAGAKFMDIVCEVVT
jgi:SPP1 family predicted phage head-tail adaptor